MAKPCSEFNRRKHEIDVLTVKIKQLTPTVLKLTGYKNESSLNGTYGGKFAKYIDIKNEVIDTPEQFISLYFQGFLRTLEDLGPKAQPGNAVYNAFLHIKSHAQVLDWLYLFLERTYLRMYDALSKTKPSVDEAVIWIGQENASYGILVAPRFKDGKWENDKSEIRHFKPKYWTIGHVIETGLVIPNKNEKITFIDSNQYLTFFRHILVRCSGSKHEMEIANRYCKFVEASDTPEDIPLLIPELRYGGIEKKHLYRLDFTVINPYNLTKVGFELSPWSTHGNLTGVAGKTQKVVNEEALKNFENEMNKLKAYFRKFGITILVYTDSDLKNHDVIFNHIAGYLSPVQKSKQLEFQAKKQFLAFTPQLRK